MEQSDNIVFFRIVNGNPGKMVCGKQTVDFRIAVGHTAGYHIDPGRQDFFHPDVVKLDS